MTYLGIDLGTSGVKAVLIDAQQQVIDSATAPLSVQRPHVGWSEQAPESWIEATSQAIDTIAHRQPSVLAALSGIGLSGQMHGATLLDKADQVLGPCLLWNDTRSHEEAQKLDSMPCFREATGNIVFPGFTAPKLDWVRNNQPDLWSKVAKVLLPKDYLRLWLTGEHVSEMSDASGTSWLNVGERDWDDRLLSATQLDRGHMPRLVEGDMISGDLRQALATRWGIKNPVKVAGGAGDNAATACGLGIVSAGDAFVSLGTSGVIFAANDRFLPRPQSAVHAFCHAASHRWHQMGVVLNASDALGWLAEVLQDSPSRLTSALPASFDLSGCPIFLPYLNGERTPHNDAKIRGSFVGLDRSHTRDDLVNAVLEGVAFALLDSVAALQSAGTTLERLVAVGGGSQSRHWLQIVANVCGLPIDLPRAGDFGAAFGAARLGQACVLTDQSSKLDVFSPVSVVETIEPGGAVQDRCAERYSQFQKIYPALKECLS